jgi:hypothetical protein
VVQRFRFEFVRYREGECLDAEDGAETQGCGRRASARGPNSQWMLKRRNSGNDFTEHTAIRVSANPAGKRGQLGRRADAAAAMGRAAGKAGDRRDQVSFDVLRTTGVRRLNRCGPALSPCQRQLRGARYDGDGNHERDELDPHLIFPGSGSHSREHPVCDDDHFVLRGNRSSNAGPRSAYWKR